MKRFLMVPAFVLLTAASSHAQQQAVSLNIGYFAVRGEDARVEGDVLAQNRSFLAFDIDEFSNAAVSGEWLAGVGENVEIGAGLGYYGRSVPSAYARRVHSDFSEIEQDLKLRIVPVTATIRFLPLGRSSGVQPYLGAGVGLFRWRYSEVGEFVDFRDDTIFRARYFSEGTSMGPVILGGLRAPLGDKYFVGGELRYQKAEGDLESDDFFGDKIDLGGFVLQAAFAMRF